MIAVDTSAFAAIILDESDAPAFLDAMFHARECVIGAPTEFELRLVLFKRVGAGSAEKIDQLFDQANVRVLPFDTGHAALAVDALTRFGRGPAWLNYGDCMCYAIAKKLDIALLFKGDDFIHTDLRFARIGT